MRFDFAQQVRRLRPDIALGADIIAGFPTETEEMFRGVRSSWWKSAISHSCMCFPIHRGRARGSADAQVSGDAIKERARRLRGPARLHCKDD